MRGDRLAPSAGLNEGFVPIKARGGEAAQIRRGIVGDFSRKPPAMGEPACMRIALGRQDARPRAMVAKPVVRLLRQVVSLLVA